MADVWDYIEQRINGQDSQNWWELDFRTEINGEPLSPSKTSETIRRGRRGLWNKKAKLEAERLVLLDKVRKLLSEADVLSPEHSSTRTDDPEFWRMEADEVLRRFPGLNDGYFSPRIARGMQEEVFHKAVDEYKRKLSVAQLYLQRHI
jgi:hypothetical protein